LARGPTGELTGESVSAFRGAAGKGGYIIGFTESRQLQNLRGDRAHIWAVAIGTCHLERADDRCVEHGILSTDLVLTGWGGVGIRFSSPPPRSAGSCSR